MKQEILGNKKIVCSECVKRMPHENHNLSGTHKCYYCNSTIDVEKDDFTFETSSKGVKTMGRDRQ